MGLATYRRKRDFQITPEPKGQRTPRGGFRYVIHKHAATRLHYDLRLELDGVLKSWAVPKGPSLDPADKRLAVEVEDHPIEYGGFEGTIPKGEYGGGVVLLWDRGKWIPEGDPHQGLRQGKLEFELRGEKLQGGWTLVRMERRSREEGKSQWLLIKSRDPHARPGDDVLALKPESVKTGRTIEDIEAGRAKPGRSKPPKMANAPATAQRPTSPAKPEKAGTRAPRRGVTKKPGSPTARSGPRSAGKTARGGRAGGGADPSEIPGVRRGELPDFIAPQLATLVAGAPDGELWLHEIKYDGYRALCRLERGRARLLTRSGQDWTEAFQTIAQAAERLPAREALLDGEVVVLEEDGTSRFQSLQTALSNHDQAALVYFAFDLLHLDGFDLRGAPLEERKRTLDALLGRSQDVLRYSAHVLGHGPEFHAVACARRLEGIVSKRRDAPYASRRTRDWLKVKCSLRQEVVIGGFTEPRGARESIGSLLVGVHEPGGLRYAGRVGTGFTAETLRDLHAKLERLETREAPFLDPPRLPGVHWVRPRLVGEVAFTEWTKDGMLRHPSFRGLRDDKPASQVVREPVREPPPPGQPKAPVREPNSEPPARDPERRPPVEEPVRKPPERDPGRETPVGEPSTALRLTHPERVLYPENGITKLDVARYYAEVGDLMVEQIAGRPLMLKRCPEGHTKPCFFQKHPGRGSPAVLETVEIREASGTATYLTLDGVEGLIALVQIGALEIHVWGSRREHLERPDAMVFDIDPDPTTPWKVVIEIARRVRAKLEHFDLDSFVKTTGGKGLHVLVPLEPSAEWDAVRRFSTGVAAHLVREAPDVITTHLAKAKRGGRVFLDTLRNGRGATWVAPYSTRARAGAPVSAPVDWSELTARLHPERYTVANFSRRLALRPDPWAHMKRVRQRLTATMLRAAEKSI